MSTTSTKIRCPKGYVRLSPSMLRKVNDLPVAIYYCDGESDRAVLFREANVQVDEHTLDELIESKGSNLFLRTSDFKNTCAELLDSLGDLVSDDTMEPTDRFSMLQAAVSFEVERTLKAIDPSHYVGLVADVSRHINALVTENDLVPEELFAIARHDSQTFTHVTNTASYATMLAEKLGITDDAELDQIAMGAMLHDMGKRSIPSHILSKPGRLTTEERELIQTHPQRGYEELVTRIDVSHEQKLMVYQHHEHFDGNGYPVRIRGSEIHPWARLLSVVDVFDALTGSRPYRRPMTMHEAAEFIESRAGTQFDKEMAQCWVAAVKSN